MGIALAPVIVEFVSLVVVGVLDQKLQRSRAVLAGLQGVAQNVGRIVAGR